MTSSTGGDVTNFIFYNDRWLTRYRSWKFQFIKTGRVSNRLAAGEGEPNLKVGESAGIIRRGKRPGSKTHQNRGNEIWPNLEGKSRTENAGQEYQRRKHQFNSNRKLTAKGKHPKIRTRDPDIETFKNRHRTKNDDSGRHFGADENPVVHSARS